MVKEIKLFGNDKIKIDFDKVYSYIANWYILFLFVIHILYQDIRYGLTVLSVKTIIYIIVTAIISITIVCTKILEGNFKLNKYYWVLGIYLILIIISALLSEYSDNVLFGNQSRGEGVVTLLCYMLTFCIIYEGFKFNKKLFNLSTVAVCVAAAYGILQALFAGKYTFFGEFENIAYSNFGNPNMFSSFLSIFLPIYIVKYFTSDKKIWILACSILFGALLVSRTMGGYITFVIYFGILLVYFSLFSKSKRKGVIKGITLILIFILVFIILNSCVDNLILKEIKGLFLEVENLDEEKGIEEFGTHRVYIWKKCFDILKDNMLFGIGPDSLKAEMLSRKILLNGVIIDKAHNEYLQIAVTTGILSLIAYLVYIWFVCTSLLKKYIKNVKKKRRLDNDNIMIIAVAASLVSYLVQAFGNISIIGVAPLFWGMLAIGANISKNNEITIEEK